MQTTSSVGRHINHSGLLPARRNVVLLGGRRADPGELVRPVARLEQLSYWPALAARVRALAAAGLHAAAIAQRLNAEGYRPPKRHERFGPQGVQDLLHRVGAHKPQPRPHRQ